MVIRSKAVDALRGLAVIFMLVFHLAVDLEDFYGYAIGYRYGGWKVFNNLIVIMFIMVSGYTAAMGWGRREKALLRLFAASVLVTFATYFFNSEMFVRFGILHFLFAANLLFPLFKDMRTLLLLAMIPAAAALGYWLGSITVKGWWLIFLGAAPEGFYTYDYYPLLPWLSFFIAGVVLQRYVKFEYTGGNVLVGGCAFFGRHALLVYLAHQPLFLLSLSFILGRI